MHLTPLIASALLLSGTPLLGQTVGQIESTTKSDTDGEEEQKAEDISTPAIVVTGSKQTRQVLIGSRLPRDPVVVEGQIATNTGVMGLVPQSGMDPFAGATRTKRTITCVSELAEIRKQAACLVADADKYMASGDNVTALGLLQRITFEGGFNPQEHLAASQRIYAIGFELQDEMLRKSALVDLLETGLLSQSDTIAAHRSLLAIALKNQETELAVDRLQNILRITADNAQDWANLAVLQKELDNPASRSSMIKAIELRQASGRPVESSWKSFVGQ